MIGDKPSTVPLEMHFLVIINECRRFVILDGTRQSAIACAMRAYDELYPDGVIQELKIILMGKDTVLGYKILHHVF